jgi:hypothetical protein
MYDYFMPKLMQILLIDQLYGYFQLNFIPVMTDLKTVIERICRLNE